MSAAAAEVRIFGIRHHGPGSSRSLVAALERFEPQIVLIEGPPEADGIAELAGDPAMEPPVAILVYATDEGRRAAFYPFAAFSPEWQALRYARERGVPARFIDLPLANVLAQPDGRVAHRAAGEDDPLDEIGRIAGYPDGELWWDAFVERRAGTDAFEALEEMMRDLRAGRETSPEEARREAAMRRGIRSARKACERVAVVCGAWHVPALRESGSATHDNELLASLPKTKVAATWIPWTNGRLTFASGYGAGVASPGWYEHLWQSHGDLVPAWMAKSARILRDAGLDVAASHAIEATRLAEALAALRDAPAVGLGDLTDAIGTVYAFGEAAPMRLLERGLIVGERLGHVPDRVTNVPLLADLAAEQKRLRLPADAAPRALELDLRKPLDLERSRLLHRTNVLGVPWGRAAESRSGSGTFWERWDLQWEPEFALRVIEASPYGNRIAPAAAARAIERSERASELSELTAILEATLRSDLTTAVDAVLTALAALAARTNDVAHLLDAIPPLAQVGRYGDVRQTDAASVAAVLDTLVIRASIGTPAAMRSLDDTAAAGMYERLVAVDAAIRTLDVAAQREAWDGALAAVAADARAHGLVAGRATRLRYDAQSIAISVFRHDLAMALGKAASPDAAAAWIEGAFRRSGSILMHETNLLGAVDAWLQSLDDLAFVATLPLVRRTFGTFAKAERSAIGDAIAAGRHGGGATLAAPPETARIDWARAHAVLPALREIFGVELPA